MEKLSWESNPETLTLGAPQENGSARSHYSEAVTDLLHPHPQSFQKLLNISLKSKTTEKEYEGSEERKDGKINRKKKAPWRQTLKEDESIKNLPQ